ncbi:MAG TPA: glycosyltransferase family 9 protein [Telmatospirillum sp.]|nr:glycosyltransferase family 9 protein [Telmatospirillum sp.]
MVGQQRILVIKFSSLGDFVQAMGPFAAIRAHHPEAKITVLTAKPFVALAEQCPYFDDVWIDTHPRPWEVAGLMRLRKKLRSVKFDMVYDLQTSDRSSSYFHLMGDPPWSGTAHNCSHPHANPDRDLMHVVDRQAEQLAMAGIASTPPADLSWIKADVGRFFLPARYALIVPGGAPHRPAKRWPADRFALVAKYLAERGVTPVVLGTSDDADQIKVVTNNCPATLSLSGRTDFMDVAALARGAAGAVGNDTGPMHLIAAAGCPSVLLFSADTDPALCAPRGLVSVLREDDLTQLELSPVLAAMTEGPAALR